VKFPEEALNKIFFGSDEVLKLSNTPLGVTSNYFMTFEGVVNYVGNQETMSGRPANGKRQGAVYPVPCLSRVQRVEAEEGGLMVPHRREEYR
jgi:hypothetical protein